MRSTKAIRIAKTSYIILSALFIVLGVGLIALRDLSVSLIGIAAGVMLIAFGIVKLIGYFSKDLYRLAFQFDLSLGLMLAVLGVIILRNPDQAMSFLCLMLGIATERPAAQVAADCLRDGLMVLTAKDKVRLLPPLNISFDEIQQGITILKKNL